MKEKTRNTEVQINKEKIGKLPEKQFRIIIVKMTNNHGIIIIIIIIIIIVKMTNNHGNNMETMKE